MHKSPCQFLIHEHIDSWHNLITRKSVGILWIAWFLQQAFLPFFPCPFQCPIPQSLLFSPCSLFAMCIGKHAFYSISQYVIVLAKLGLILEILTFKAFELYRHIVKTCRHCINTYLAYQSGIFQKCNVSYIYLHWWVKPFFIYVTVKNNSNYCCYTSFVQNIAFCFEGHIQPQPAVNIMLEFLELDKAVLCKDSKRMKYCKIDKNTSLAYKSMFIYCSIWIHQDMVILELIKIIDNYIYNYNRDIKI